MKKLLICIGLICSNIFASVESFPADSLRRSIESVFAKGGLGGTWGLEIWSVSRGAEVLGVRQDDLFMPASTGKLFATAAALDVFPENYRFKTRVELSGIKQGRVFKGRLKIIGGGDPGLSERFYPENQPLLGWADSLKSWGIDTLVGEVVADEGYFQDRRPNTWKLSFFDDWYGAEPSALSWQDNLAWMSIAPGASRGAPCRLSVSPDVGAFQFVNACNTAKSGGHLEHLNRDSLTNKVVVSGNVGQKAGTLKFRVPVRNPAEYLRLSMIKIMGERGVAVVDGDQPMGQQLPFFKGFDFYGITMEQAVLVTNSRSHNLFAEMILRHLSQNKYHSGNVANGLRAVHDFLRKYKIPTDAFKMVDGSGLSYQNRVSPRLVSRLLAVMLRHPREEVFYKSLAAPGFGTGGRRMPQLKYPEVTRFKTGFVNGTQGLSGYILASDGDTLCVSLNLNGYRGNDDKARSIMDKAWTMIADYVNAERPAQKDMKKVWQANQSPASWESRLQKISSAWLGRPYAPHPLGDGVWSMQDRAPIARTTAFDDQSYVQHVMATSYAPRAEYVYDALLQTRYFGGKVGFQDRRHFFYPDLFQGNSWIKEFVFLGSVKSERILNRQKVFALAGLRYPGANSKVQVRYLPIQQALKTFAGPWADQTRFLGVGIVPKLDDQWSSQLGFVLLEKGQEAIFRHASVTAGKVLDESLSKWLNQHSSDIDGLVFWEMKAPI